MSKTLYYVDIYTDEVCPCVPTLAGWASYLADPEAHGDEIAAAKPGETFAVSTIEVLGDVRVEFQDGEWSPVESIPDGATFFFARYHEGGEGWDVENAGDTIAVACCELDEDDSPAFLACTRDGPSYTATFDIKDGKPVLTLSPTQGEG